MGSFLKDMGAQDGIYQDLDGAPFRIGDEVRVVQLADETADPKYLDHEGTVQYFEYACGCGQRFPNDPMIGVKFSRKIDEFWKEELRLIKRPRIRPVAKLSRRAARLLLRKLVGEERFQLLTW